MPRRRSTAAAFLLGIVAFPAVAGAEDRPELPAAIRARTPSAACSAFLPEDRPRCTRRLASYHETLDAIEAQEAEASPEARCQLRCDVLEENWKLHLDTRGWSEAAFRSLSSGAYERRNAQLARRNAERLAVKAERDGLVAELDELKRKDRTPAVEAEIAGKEARQIELEARLLELGRQTLALEEASRDPATERRIERMWQGRCSSSEADARIAACRARCRGAEPSDAVPECRF